MLKTKRRSLQFDCLEGKMLLSNALADPATVIQQDVVKHFHLNGALVGLPLGSASHSGFSVSTFLVQGHIASLHRVTGFLNLADTLIPTGKKPNLTSASLTLVNRQGSVVLTIYKTTNRYYDFKVVSGTDSYADAAGSGILTIRSSTNSGAINFVIRLHTTTT